MEGYRLTQLLDVDGNSLNLSYVPDKYFKDGRWKELEKEIQVLFPQNPDLGEDTDVLDEIEYFEQFLEDNYGIIYVPVHYEMQTNIKGL